MNKKQTSHVELKEQTLERAMDAFLRYGIRAVRMDDIAAEMGISKRTLYEMFSDKETLLIECLEYQHTKDLDTYKRMCEESDNALRLLLSIHKLKQEQLKSVNNTFFTDLSKYERVVKFFESKSKQRDEEAVGFFMRCVEQGLFRKDINYGLIRIIMNYVEDGIMSHELYQKFSRKEIFDTMVLVIVRGMCTPKGLEVLAEYMK